MANDEAKRAAAVRYDPEKERAPRLLAQANGKLAEKLVAIAIEHNVPVFEDPDTVRILSGLELGREIPDELYQAVAQVLAFVYRENEKWKSRSAR